MLRIVAAVVVAALSVSAVEAAGEASDQVLADQLNSLADLAGSGNYIEATAALDGATTLIWDRSPLAFRKALWVTEPPAGFGAYTPRPTNEYAAGDEMIAYVEPVGFGWRHAGDL